MPAAGIRRFLSIRIIGLATGFMLSLALHAAPPRVAVSIPPWHPLAAGITEGIADVDLLLPAGHSPHEGGLAPSTLRSMLSAELVAWTGPLLETGLSRALEQLDESRKLTLSALPEMRSLPLRQSGIHRGHGHGDDGHDHGHDHGHDNVKGMLLDPHLWLAPENARAFALAFTDRMAVMDPANEAAYRQNLAGVLRRIDASEAAIRRDLEALVASPFLVFHDAYQYFEDAFGISSAAAVTLGPDRKPGARKLRTLRQLIQDRSVQCVFTEPQFEPTVVQVLTENLEIRVGMLDPLGANLDPGPDLWFALMEGLRDSLRECLEPV